MVSITITGDEKQIQAVIQLNKRRVQKGLITISPVEEKEEKKSPENKVEKKTFKTKEKK